MKQYYLLLLIVGSLFTINTAAQSKLADDNLKAIASQEATELGTKLFLEENQVKAIEKINFEYAVQVRSVLTNANVNENAPEKINELDVEKQMAVDKVLNDQQKMLYDRINSNEYQLAVDGYKDLMGNYSGNEQMVDELTTYFSQQILPQLLAHRIKLGQTISDEDEDSLRVYNKAFKKVVVKVVDEQVESGKITAPNKVMLVKLTKENKDLLNKVKQMRKKYQEELDLMSIALTPHEEKWEKDIKGIAKNYLLESEIKDFEKKALKMGSYGAKYSISQMTMLLFDTENPHQFQEVVAKLQQINITEDKN